MKLEIKGHEVKGNIIEFVSESGCVVVEISGEVMARFYDDGDFIFYGKSGSSRYSGNWNK